MFNLTSFLNQSKENTAEVLNNYDNACHSLGKYYITDINNYEYLHLKAFFDDILIYMAIRYIAYNLNFICFKIKGKAFKIKFIDLTKIQYMIFKVRKGYFKEWNKIFKMNNKKALKLLFPIIKINPFMEIYDFMLNLIEIRILFLIVYMVF